MANTQEIVATDLVGIYKEIAELIGVEATVILHKNFRGQQITLPKKLFTKEYILRQVQDEENIKKSSALFNNYKDGFINRVDGTMVVNQIITLNPYRMDVYEYLVKEDGDFNREIERLADYLGYDLKPYKNQLMDEYIDDCLKNDTDIEFIKEKVVKYAKYIGSLNEAIYLTRIDAIQMFENA